MLSSCSKTDTALTIGTSRFWRSALKPSTLTRLSVVAIIFQAKPQTEVSQPPSTIFENNERGFREALAKLNEGHRTTVRRLLAEWSKALARE